ncbi:MAG: formyltransferase family protein [Dehalococcoidales bacterium]|nr:formyltransferase family protein [Dehalococcoidales bacterium]
MFDVRYIGQYNRNQKKFSPEVFDIFAQPVDYLFNYLSPIIVPGCILQHVRCAAINFHPAPPELPGVGSASYALYENAESFGVTAHLMTEQIDAGEIIRVIRFPIVPEDTCDRLFQRALNYSLILFYEVLYEIARAGQVTFSNEKWKRKAFTRKQFERWMTLLPTDTLDEFDRKVRAIRHSQFPGPFLEINGLRFELPPRKDD